MDCEKAALFHYPEKFNEANGGGDTNYDQVPDGEDESPRDAYATSCTKA